MERLTNLFVALFLYPVLLVGVWFLVIVVALWGHPEDDSTFPG
jgi:hypothetical protein